MGNLGISNSKYLPVSLLCLLCANVYSLLSPINVMYIPLYRNYDNLPLTELLRCSMQSNCVSLDVGHKETSLCTVSYRIWINANEPLTLMFNFSKNYKVFIIPRRITDAIKSIIICSRYRQTFSIFYR